MAGGGWMWVGVGGCGWVHCLGQPKKYRDVVVEPPLIPVNPSNYKHSTNTQAEARLDIAATGFHSTFQPGAENRGGEGGHLPHQ